MTRERLDRIAAVGSCTPHKNEIEELVAEVNRAWEQIAHLQREGTRAVNRRRNADAFMIDVMRRVASGKLVLDVEQQVLLMKWRLGIGID